MLYSGKNLVDAQSVQASGQFIDICGEQFYEICHYDRMQPFFISLASDTDLWMYLSSTGGLSCGRRSPETALFPYYTDDKITEQYEQTGPKTIIRASRAGDEAEYLWEPFSFRQQGAYDIRRKIAKSTVGNKIVFCEENLDLGLRFSYMWCSADKFGWIRRATIENLRAERAEIEIVDGLQNVLPAGVNRITQNTYSTLVDGYKKTELVGSLVLFRMEAIMVDKAEPSESLRCNTILCLNVPQADYLVSSRQLDSFREGADIESETEAKGVRGAIFMHSKMSLGDKESKQWYFVADVQKDAVKVRDIMHFASQADAVKQIEEAITLGTQTLQEIVAQNDGVQHTGDEYNDARHFANTLFNTMRGGFYLDDYNIQGEAFKKHIGIFNKPLLKKHCALLDSLPETISRGELETLVRATGDEQLVRLFNEYLPITFGRRHGDPSRPWNLFSIRVNDENGKRVISYQGNWRDIFQNWEALSLSYPGFINSIISKFLNATTIDGYNPYKVTSEGIDWEVINPDDPWSNIGYWGDHQIIYLLKLLELSYKHDPKVLQRMLNEKAFAFANVPYRLKSYSEILADPKNSILFDNDLHQKILGLIPSYGQDARLVLNGEGDVCLTTMIDKLVLTLLAKMSNFVPGAGIWMNTLRPEWNDANNALVGYGASMVTLYYIRRYIVFLKQLTEGVEMLTFSKEIRQFMDDMMDGIRKVIMEQELEAFDDKSRRLLADAFGKAGERYREAAYTGLSGETVEIDRMSLYAELDALQDIVEETINNSKRDDGLYHAYNLISFTDDSIKVTHLYSMLEGQVAVLTSGILSGEESADLLDAMRHSDLYREDQRSYMLYPARKRKTFLEMNNIPEDARQTDAVKQLLGNPNQHILLEDRDGALHFSGDFNNADFLQREAEREGLSEEHIQQLKDLYEQVFNHHAFTGRSGTFYKYEGLGCIYWHMVSKLLLAVGETIEAYTAQLQAGNVEADAVLARLKKHYAAIREGIGSHKAPAEYGSFPFDAYSHTPSMAGVQQPGMTGQVKEDIINRFFELGVSVKDGQIRFCPQMLSETDFINGELCFTYCNIPVVYRLAQDNAIQLSTLDGELQLSEMTLPKQLSEHIFARDGFVKQIIVKGTSKNSTFFRNPY